MVLLGRGGSQWVRRAFGGTPASVVITVSQVREPDGLRPPAMSWGVMLQQAQNVQTVALSPWLLIPAIPVVVVILAFNFMGDGLRDAADPYGV
jgi:peptide/nickel transport system permease protein